MPKVQFIDPAAVRKPGFVEFQPIPVNQYQKTVKDEKGKTCYKQNFINYSINDYKLSENGTYQDIINRQLLNRNLQDGENESNIDL